MDKDDRIEVEALLSKLTSISLEFDKSRPPNIPLSSKERLRLEVVLMAEKLIRPTPNLERIAELEAQLNPEPDNINLSLTPLELTYIHLALLHFIQRFKAEEYIKGSIGTGIKNEKRWAKVAEIMLINEPEKLRRRGKEFNLYCALIRSGVSARKASEKVYKFYKNTDDKFPSQEACDKWLNDEVKRKQKEYKEKGHGYFYADIPKPSKSPRDE